MSQIEEYKKETHDALQEAMSDIESAVYEIYNVPEKLKNMLEEDPDEYFIEDLVSKAKFTLSSIQNAVRSLCNAQEYAKLYRRAVDSEEENSEQDDPESRDWANGYGSDGEVDGDALASAGMGEDEAYGGYGNSEDW